MLKSLKSFRRLGLVGVGTKFNPFPKATFSIGERLVLDRLVMKRSLSSANCLKILFFLNRFDFQQVREKRLAFCWDCEMCARLVKQNNFEKSVTLRGQFR